MFYVAIAVGLITLVLLWLKKRNAFDPASVRGRRILITGASSGIGEELAYQYARLHANVMVTARREDFLKKVVEKCKTLGCGRGKFFYHVSDMANYKTESKSLIEECVKKMGGLDTIILNHAYFGNFTVWCGTQENLDMFDMATEVNYKSYVHIMSYALPYLNKSTFGRIGVTGSISGKFGWPLVTHYSGCKFALDGFFSSLRAEAEQAKTKLSVTLSVLGFVGTKNVMDILQADFIRLVSFGSGNNIERVADHVVAATDETAYEVMKATETGKRELYYSKWWAGVYFKMPISMVPLIRHFFPNLVVNAVWKPKLYKEFKESLEK